MLFNFWQFPAALLISHHGSVLVLLIHKRTDYNLWVLYPTATSYGPMSHAIALPCIPIPPPPPATLLTSRTPHNTHARFPPPPAPATASPVHTGTRSGAPPPPPALCTTPPPATTPRGDPITLLRPVSGRSIPFPTPPIPDAWRQTEQRRDVNVVAKAACLQILPTNCLETQAGVHFYVQKTNSRVENQPGCVRCSQTQGASISAFCVCVCVASCS